MNIEEKNEELSNQMIKGKGPSNCNKKINNYFKFPTMTIEKIIRLVMLLIGTIVMLINCFTGIAISMFTPDCLEDMSHNYTSSINNFFYESDVFNMVLKFISSLVVDILIIYTLIVWSLYSTNIRLLTTGVSYMLFNFLVRFIHIQRQPEKVAFTMNHLFSIFINYQITTYSFYSVFAGLMIICAFEWKRNNNKTMFWIIIISFICESLIIIVMHGNYFHEIFSGGLIGHYLFMMNEKVLSLMFGKEYIGEEEDSDKGKISSSIFIDKSVDNIEKEKNEEITESKHIEDNETNANEL
jgi:hypothetical protein